MINRELTRLHYTDCSTRIIWSKIYWQKRRWVYRCKY